MMTYPTYGLLFDVTDDRKFLCYTLEDPYHKKKIHGETRIPSGIYDIILLTNGALHHKYQKRFPCFHKGMLWLQDVPGFTGVLIHTGNTPKHTKGCLLVGDAPVNNIDNENFLGASTIAYERLYRLIVEPLKRTEKVTIHYKDFDSLK